MQPHPTWPHPGQATATACHAGRQLPRQAGQQPAQRSTACSSSKRASAEQAGRFASHHLHMSTFSVHLWPDSSSGDMSAPTRPDSRQVVTAPQLSDRRRLQAGAAGRTWRGA